MDITDIWATKPEQNVDRAMNSGGKQCHVDRGNTNIYIYNTFRDL
jgi:hypothetical protein